MSTDWLHRPAIYDVLLIFAGLPIAIWLTYRVGLLLPSGKVSQIIVGATYVYTFLATLSVFRVLFSYSRWVFPKVEIESELRSPSRHRAIWAAILIPLISSVLYDVMRTIFSNPP